MSRTSPARHGELVALERRIAEQLHERRTRRREPLGHLRRHRRVEHGRVPFEATDLRADSTGRDDEHREQHHRRTTVTCHDRSNITIEGQCERDRVRDHAGQRRRERTLRTDDVVVEPADEGARCGCGWKKATGMVCMWSNTARRRSRMMPSPSRDDLSRSNTPTTASRTAIAAITAASRHHGAHRFAVDDRVDGPPGEHRRGDAECRRDRGEQRGRRAMVDRRCRANSSDPAQRGPV